MADKKANLWIKKVLYLRITYSDKSDDERLARKEISKMEVTKGTIPELG